MALRDSCHPWSSGSWPAPWVWCCAQSQGPGQRKGDKRGPCAQEFLKMVAGFHEVYRSNVGEPLMGVKGQGGDEVTQIPVSLGMKPS